MFQCITTQFSGIYNSWIITGNLQNYCNTMSFLHWPFIQRTEMHFVHCCKRFLPLCMKCHTNPTQRSGNNFSNTCSLALSYYYYTGWLIFPTQACFLLDKFHNVFFFFFTSSFLSARNLNCDCTSFLVLLTCYIFCFSY